MKKLPQITLTHKKCFFSISRLLEVTKIVRLQTTQQNLWLLDSARSG
jgi:hypothetical protein